MDDRELDRLFALTRQPAPEMPSIAPAVLARIGHKRRSGWWFALVPVPAVALVLGFVLTPEPSERLQLPMPVASMPPPSVPVARTKPPVRKPAPLRTEFITRDGQIELHMETNDPAVKIIWITEGDSQ